MKTHINIIPVFHCRYIHMCAKYAPDIKCKAVFFWCAPSVFLSFSCSHTLSEGWGKSRHHLLSLSKANMEKNWGLAVAALQHQRWLSGHKRECEPQHISKTVVKLCTRLLCGPGVTHSVTHLSLTRCAILCVLCPLSTSALCSAARTLPAFLWTGEETREKETHVGMVRLFKLFSETTKPISKKSANNRVTVMQTQ